MSDGKVDIATALDAPIEVRRLLKSYDSSALRWEDLNDRYAIIREILLRGDNGARRWLRRVLPRREVREIVRQYAGAGCSEPDRARLRRALALTTVDLPTRPYVGLRPKVGDRGTQRRP